VQPDLTIVQVSEMGLLVRSTAMMNKEMQIEIESPGLSKYIEIQGSFFCTVIDCQRLSFGKYLLRLGYVGIAEDALKKIRALAIRGEFLTTD